MSCPQCCATGVHDTDSCERLFQEVIGHEFSRSELFGVHRLTVDAYSLQHPDRYMKSTKSAAAHLSGLCWSLERAWVDARRWGQVQEGRNERTNGPETR